MRVARGKACTSDGLYSRIQVGVQNRGRTFSDSVRKQVLEDFHCIVGLDPPTADVRPLIEPFRADPRFQLHENSERLGWDANVRTLLSRVESPLFAVLLHDDLLHPEYCATLAAPMAKQPELSVSYSDVWQFGGQDAPSIISMDLPENAPRADQIIAIRGARRATLRIAIISSARGAFSWRVDRYDRRSVLATKLPDVAVRDRKLWLFCHGRGEGGAVSWMEHKSS